LKLKLSLLILALVVVNSGYCQRYNRKFKFKQIGPISVPNTTSDSGTWSPNGMGWIESLAVYHRNPQIMYAGSNSGGLYRTEDGGEKWEFRFDIPLVTGALTIFLNQDDPNELWVGSGTPVNQYSFGLGVLHSKDAGKSWQSTGLRFEPKNQKVIWDIESSRSRPQNMFAITNDDVYWSRDQFLTHEKVWSNDAKEAVDFREIIINDSRNDAMVAGNKLLVSDSSYSSWQDVSDRLSFKQNPRARGNAPDRYALAQNPLNENVVLVLYRFGYLNFIDRSEDWGQTWKNIYQGRDFSRVDRNHAEIAIDPTDTSVIYVGAVRMYKSENAGASFKLISRPIHKAKDWMHDDIRELFILPSGDVYTGNDGGVALSKDKGESWIDVSGTGLTVTQIYGIACSQHNKKELLIGCQDLSSFYHKDDQWTNLGRLYGDGGQCLLGDSIKVVMQNGRFQTAKENIFDWDMVQMPFRTDRLNYPIAFGEDENIIYATDHHVWKKDGRNWENLTQELGQHATKIQAMSVFYYEGNAIYLIAKDQPTWALNDGLKERLFLGIGDGQNIEWKDITVKLPILAWRSVSDVLIDPENPYKMWVSLYGYDDYGPEKVYESSDRGETWTNISEGLPNLNTFSIAKISKSKDGLLAGTEGGLYFRNDKIGHWVKLKGKMPNVIVRDLALQERHKRLYIGTYGNGAWELKLARYLRK